MAKYGSGSITINVDDSAGGAQAMTQYVLSASAVEVESILEESHAFTDAWREHLAVGLRQMNPLTFEGFYDDLATTGPHIVFGDVASSPTSITKTVTIVWGGGKSTAVEAYINKYERIAERGKLTRFRAELSPTGTVVEV